MRKVTPRLIIDGIVQDNVEENVQENIYENVQENIYEMIAEKKAKLFEEWQYIQNRDRDKTRKFFDWCYKITKKIIRILNTRIW